MSRLRHLAKFNIKVEPKDIRALLLMAHDIDGLYLRLELILTYVILGSINIQMVLTTSVHAVLCYMVDTLILKSLTIHAGLMYQRCLRIALLLK